MRHGDLVFVNDDHPEFGYVGPARFVKDILPKDKGGGKWDGYVHLLELEPHCAVTIKGDGLAVFPTRCVTLKNSGDENERI